MKAGLLLGGLALLAVAAARPQIGSRSVLLPREGADVMVALDASRSMLATDVDPSRFERAKVLINQLLDGLQGDRAGLVVFAGNAVLRFPLTTDIAAARELVGSTVIREGGLRPGTGIGDALGVAADAFRDDGARSKIVVLISDGEDLGDGAVEAVRALRDGGIQLHTIGLGTDAGSTLPNTDPRTGQVQNQLDPQTRQPTISRANESLMRAVATAGDGRFFNGNGGDPIGELSQEISTLQRTKFESQEGSIPVERFQWFLAPGIALIVLSMLISERRRRPRTAAAPRDEGRRAA
ncbi:MAG: VWA domain-containing protein, partial [Dehalococcoidia bacterium]